VIQQSPAVRTQTPRRYDPALCGLCGSAKYEVILDLPHTSLTSDSRIIQEGLRKYECAACKLVRNGYIYEEEKLSDHYTSYTLGQQASVAEPVFYTEEGTVPRSKIVFDWMMSTLSSAGFSNPRSIVEIGCGEGSLLTRFADHFETSAIIGIDMSEASLEYARRKGLEGQKGSYQDIHGKHDLIFSFAVIEHVPAPMDFLTTLKSHLQPGGLLLVSQPCQDNGSNDIFFADHLHHFFSRHVSEFGHRAGLVELVTSVNHRYIPEFSLHVFGNQGPGSASNRDETKIRDVRDVIARWTRTFAGIDLWLATSQEKKLAVWGVGQTFRMILAYTRLKDHSITLGFDDNPTRFAHDDLSFPLMAFGSTAAIDLSSYRILLTFKPSLRVRQQLQECSVDFYSPLDYV
jgi:2-polyprenyl-3-methyl-5-hydroxy-6-metoxy-1,4-benzoquinol methylase